MALSIGGGGCARCGAAIAGSSGRWIRERPELEGAHGAALSAILSPPPRRPDRGAQSRRSPNRRHRTAPHLLPPPARRVAPSAPPLPTAPPLPAALADAYNEIGEVFSVSAPFSSGLGGEDGGRAGRRGRGAAGGRPSAAKRFPSPPPPSRCGTARPKGELGGGGSGGHCATVRTALQEWGWELGKEEEEEEEEGGEVGKNNGPTVPRPPPAL